MTHPGDMTRWEAITCQRRHDAHEGRSIHVDLNRPHGYHDLPAVPPDPRLAWDMMIWPPERYPVDGGPYCPAHDAVSETIVSHGIWEPMETILAAQVLGSAQAGQVFVDVGAQLGWYCLLAAALGVPAIGYEADPANAGLCAWSASMNGWAPLVEVRQTRVDEDTPPLERMAVRLAKIDVEGAEADALVMLGPSLDAGWVDHLLIECSPVFHDGYDVLLAGLVDRGYELYRLPDKSQPPVTDVQAGLVPLAPGDLDPHQEDVWCRRAGASW